MEVELKLLVIPKAAEALWTHPLIQQHAASEWYELAICDTYYDTAELDILRSGASLRVRRAGNEWLQTFKAGGSVDGGLHNRHEWETEHAGSTPDVAALCEMVSPSTVWGQLLNTAGLDERLSPAFSTLVTRRVLQLRLPTGDEVELALDFGILECGAQQIPISELELELKTGDPVHLFDFALALLQDIPMRIGGSSKSERGFGLIAPGLAGAAKSTPLKLRKGMPIEQVFQRIAGNCMAQIQANAGVLTEAYHAGCLHQMRVGLRRLRSALVMFRDHLQAPEDLQLELYWLASQLGVARDWDVLVGSTLPAAASALPHDILLTEVERAAHARAGEVHLLVSAAVCSQRYTRLILAFTRWVHGCDWRNSMSPKDLRRLSASSGKYAHNLLAKNHRRLLKRAGKLKEGDPAALHRLRISVKKMRYATEFFESFYRRKRVQPYARALAALQDEIGKLIDAKVADHLLLELEAASPDTSNSIGLVREHLVSNIHISGKRVRKDLKKLASIDFLE